MAICGQRGAQHEGLLGRPHGAQRRAGGERDRRRQRDAQRGHARLRAPVLAQQQDRDQETLQDQNEEMAHR